MNAVRLSLFVLIACLTRYGFAQPYVDIANIRYQYSPSKNKASATGIANSFEYLNASFNLPLQFNKDSSVLVFSPFADMWNISLSLDNIQPVYSIALPVTYIKPLNSKLVASITAITRWNSFSPRFSGEEFQVGGALLLTYKKQPTLHYKFGLYYNSEFSGPFFMPLVGIAWKMNEKNNIFGVLPGNLTYEHKVNSWFYYGATFRAMTNTYVTDFLATPPNLPYIRVEDNQFAVFGDLYVLQNLVLNVEVGHSVLRRLRLGYKNGDPKYYFQRNIQDNVVFKTAIAYRIRF